MTHPETPIPTPAVVLGIGGLLPFALLTLGIVIYPDPNLSYFLGWLVQYGALIASFVGALQWGHVMRDPTINLPDQWSALSWGVCPALIAWIALQLPQYSGCYLLALLFVVCWVMDWRFARRHALPSWYMRLRTLLTAGAVLSLGVAGLVLAGHVGH